MKLSTELKLLAALLAIMAIMSASAYATYRIDRHELTKLRRENRELLAVAVDYNDVMTVAATAVNGIRK